LSFARWEDGYQLKLASPWEGRGPIPVWPVIGKLLGGGALLPRDNGPGRAGERMIASMMLAGLRVPDDDVRELARLVDEPTRSLLEKALGLGTVVLALMIEHRERLLWALDVPRTLAERRAVLLQEHEGRVRDGLV
jgi:hypothetical protein